METVLQNKAIEGNGEVALCLTSKLDVIVYNAGQVEGNFTFENIDQADDLFRELAGRINWDFYNCQLATALIDVVKIWNFEVLSLFSQPVAKQILSDMVEGYGRYGGFEFDEKRMCFGNVSYDNRQVVGFLMAFKREIHIGYS